MRQQRAMTLVETMLAIVLFSVVSMTGLSIWRYSAQRTLRDTAIAQITQQANELLDYISEDIERAVYCRIRTVGPNSVLMIALPETGTDTTGDGALDEFGFGSGTPEASLRAVPGVFRWYGMVDNTGSFIGTPINAYRATGIRDSTPQGLPLDNDFNATFRGPGDPGSSRYNLIESMSFSIDSTNRRVTITVIGSNLYRNRAQIRGFENANNSVRLTFTRSVTWRNGF